MGDASQSGAAKTICPDPRDDLPPDDLVGAVSLPPVTACDNSPNRLNESPSTPRQPLPDVTACDAGGDRLNGEDPCAEMDPETGLSDRQEAAVLLLVNGRSIASISKKLGVHRQTLWRWRKDPAFMRELKRRRDAMCDETTMRVQGLCSPALDVVGAVRRSI